MNSFYGVFMMPLLYWDGAINYIENNVYVGALFPYVALYVTMAQLGFDPPNETEVCYLTTALPQSYHALKKNIINIRKDEAEINFGHVNLCLRTRRQPKLNILIFFIILLVCL